MSGVNTSVKAPKVYTMSTRERVKSIYNTTDHTSVVGKLLYVLTVPKSHGEDVYLPRDDSLTSQRYKFMLRTHGWEDE